MATLNGAEFEIIETEWSTYQNNVIQEILGSDTVEVQNQGHGSDPVRIQGMVNNEKEMDDFQEQFYSNGVLTLIKDPGTNRQYRVYALGSVKRESISNSLLATGIVFTCMMQLRYPYSESIEEITRSKSITTQNQEWSADDDSRDIRTDGNVDAVPDIQVTGGVGSVYEVSDPNPISEPGFETINDWTYSEVDTNGTLSGAQDSTYEYEGTYCYKLQLNGYFNQDDYAKITQNIDLNGIKKITFRHRKINGVFEHTQLLFQVLAGSTIIGSYGVGGSGDSGWVERSIEIDSSEQTLSFRIFSSSGAMQTCDNKNFIDAIVAYTKSPTKDPEIYNTADTTVKCAVANDILDGAIHRINADGTGHIDFDDDFSTNRYAYTRAASLNITYDTVDDELDIADDGYIYWVIDTKLPIDGIPILTSRINTTSGIPTIQISSNGTTWYDIDTAIVDDVETEYSLNSDGNLLLGGKTLFYFRFDCIKAAAATCSIKYFELDVDIHTIYAKNPKIIKGSSPSTFRIDQDSDSSMICDVTLIFKNRWWV